MYEEFQRFLQQIISDGDWEYSNGASMTEDVEEVLALLRETPKWTEVAKALTKLYEAYNNYGPDDGLVRDVLVELMEAYDC